MARKKNDKNNKNNKSGKSGKLVLFRKDAIVHVANILNQNGFCTVTHQNGLLNSAAWIEIWSKDLKAWYGNLNLTLMGSFYGTAMRTGLRSEILKLIPDDLEVVSSPREMAIAKHYDYGFWEEE